ncbi:MAG: hypothetical protein OWV35_08710 [Firmicutes bacterium]|nr:hypothetical protein [Bacillota bacterium]
MGVTEVEAFRARIQSPALEPVWRMARENIDNLPFDDLLQGLERSSQVIRHITNPRHIAMATESDWEEAVRKLRSGRRHLGEITGHMDLSRFRLYLASLVEDDTGSVEDRVQAFALSLPMLPAEVAKDIAIEFLHLAAPRRYPLVTEWVYSHRTGTGALPYLLEFTNEPGQNGKDRFRQWGAGYQGVADQLRVLEEELDRQGLAKWGAFSVDMVLAYFYADYLYKMYFQTTSRSLFGAFPTAYGVISYLLGLPIPKEAMPTGQGWEAPSDWM